MPKGKHKKIAALARAFIGFLDANCGYGADWPVSISASEDVAEELVDRMNDLRAACGITKPDHSALYRRPPALESES